MSGSAQSSILSSANILGHYSPFGDSNYVGFETRPNGLFFAGRIYDQTSNFSSFRTEVYQPSIVFAPYNLDLGQQIITTGKSIKRIDSTGVQGELREIRSQFVQTKRLVGHGNLSTPLFLNTPSLLFLEKIVSMDSSFVTTNGGNSPLEFQDLYSSTGYSLYFFKKGPGILAAIFDYDSVNGVATNAQFFKKSVSSSIENQSNTKSSLIYPNPSFSSEITWLEWPKSAMAVVFNSTGQKLIETKLNPNQPTALKLEPYQKGLFILEIQDIEGKTLSRQKWIRN